MELNMRIRIGIMFTGVAALAGVAGFVAGRGAAATRVSASAGQDVAVADGAPAGGARAVGWATLGDQPVGVDDAGRALRDVRVSPWAAGLYLGEGPADDGFGHARPPRSGTEDEFADFFARMEGRPASVFACTMSVVRASDEAFPGRPEIDVDGIIADAGGLGR
jgi:hypothetical protein